VAGTYDNDSIDRLEWLLITTAIAVVARYTGSPDAAQEFLLTEVAAKHIRYRYHGKLEFDGWAFPESYFWQRSKFVRHEITASGTVIRAGAVLVPAKRRAQSVRQQRWRAVYTASDKDGNECYVLDAQRSVTVRMPLVQLHHDDIVRRLRETGFMSASDSISAQQELPLSAPSPPPPSPPSSEQAKQEESTSAQQPKKQWHQSQGNQWLAEKVDQYPPPKERRQKSAWCRARHDEMIEDFGDEIPWSDADSLRRRLDDLLREPGNQPGKKV
jgi:hypothetical protein